MMRRHILVRTADPSGISGTGKVAEIIEWTDGTAALRWCSASHPSSTSIYESVEHIREIHGHPGTQIQPIDEDYIQHPIAKAVSEMDREIHPEDYGPPRPCRVCGGDPIICGYGCERSEQQEAAR